MATCPLVIPDDFPNKWLLASAVNAGVFFGNDLMRDTLPRLVVAKDDKDCAPTMMGTLGVIMSTLFSALSVYFLIQLLLPGTFAVGMGRLVFWYLLSAFSIVPGIVSIVLASASFGDVVSSWVVFITSVGVSYGGLLLVSGIAMALSMSIGTGINLALAVLLLAPFAKSLLPVLILLLGPTCIPLLSGMSFLEYSSRVLTV